MYIHNKVLCIHNVETLNICMKVSVKGIGCSSFRVTVILNMALTIKKTSMFACTFMLVRCAFIIKMKDQGPVSLETLPFVIL